MRNIVRNKEKLRELGIAEAVASVAACKPAAAAKRKAVKRAPTEGQRKSQRVAGQAPVTYKVCIGKHY
jgi:hypothetical protein